jgi:hypothetical protein
MLRQWGHDKSGDYAAFAWEAVTNPRVFQSFRRDPRYTAVVETLWLETGQAYLDRIDDADVRALCLQSAAADAIGGPVTHLYEGVALAPTTLRYGKVLADLIALVPHFPVLEDIVEIGVGHGGQARLVAEYAAGGGLRLKTYTCLDLAPVLLLARQYLEHFRLDLRFRFASKLELGRDERWQLAISNYAFSEFDRALQEEYLERVLLRAEAGYLTMNSGLTEAAWKNHACFTAEELCRLLPNAALIDEDPPSAPGNYRLVFGRHAAKGVPLADLRARAAAHPVQKKERRGILARLSGRTGS